MELQTQERQDLQREFGQYLKVQRERKRISLEEASKTLRISEDNLRALEKGNFARLPRMPFVAGLVTSYGRHIGCDVTQLQQRLAQLKPLLPSHAALDTVGKPNDPQLLDVHKPSFYLTRKLLFVVVSIVILALAIWVVLGLFSPEISRWMRTTAVLPERSTEVKTAEPPFPMAPGLVNPQKWENPVSGIPSHTTHE